ncbi:MAG TPA: non-canonical purine NTP pyrophosphatase [Caldilineaceae bacterium]|nr:non-canonical purine NTP pyrophosphatase [Caldilineaceae bacterium]
MELILATSSAQKAAQITALLGRPVQQQAIDLPEVQAIAVADVIEAKARVAYATVGRPVLVEDTGLMIHAWNGLPGALIRWFLESVGNEGICTMLANFPDRSATATTCIGFFDGEQCHTFVGETHGEIAPAPRGDQGFGWDAIFLPAGSTKTFGEIATTERTAISMRGKAVQALKAFLENHEQE